MKWIKAVDQIEQALAAGKAVSVQYHRKWMPQLSPIDKVDSVVEYTYAGDICKAVNTYNNQLNEGSHIIDAVLFEERN